MFARCDDTYNKLVKVFLSSPEWCLDPMHAMLAWPHIFHMLVCVMPWHNTLIARSIMWVGSCWPGVVTHTTTKLMTVFLASPERSRPHAMLAWPHICHKFVSWLGIALLCLDVSTGWDHVRAWWDKVQSITFLLELGGILHSTLQFVSVLASCKFYGSPVLHLFQNIRCFRFVKQMYLDLF